MTLGDGCYYLKSDSPFRAVGTASVSPGVCEALKGKTTQPPIAIPPYTTVAGELTLLPQVPRYAGGPPDLGYHYDALDYKVALLTVDGGKVTVEPGTAVGFHEVQ